MDDGLVIVPAGAGAGKTHRIKTQLSDWVNREVVRPERILAVTFTEAAAGELRERIRSELLAEGMVSEAMAVERAYVSTIHGLGLRLLTEHALAVGASPQPRHLGDAERDLLIRQALAFAKSLDPIKADPERYGYRPNWQSGATVEDGLRDRVMSMIELLRGLGDKGGDPSLIAPALSRLDDIYGDVLSDPTDAANSLATAVENMVAAFPEGGMASVTTKGPREKLEKNLALFSRVARDRDLLDRDWALWQSLRDLFVSNSRTKTPEGYDDLAIAIMEAADVLPTLPGPLADAKLHLSCLIECAQEVMKAYEDRKRALDLIDFADMIAGAERLLRTDDEVRQAVLDEIDCVIIDEFQDTNPIQFALLWHLGARAPRTLLVGDVKQSIMGFQGADARLSEALIMANPDKIRPLDRNWRSTPAVMNFVNAMGSGLFKAGYNPLEPTRDQDSDPAIVVLDATQGRGVRKTSKPQEHIAEHISKILVDGDTITDRRTKAERPARPSDIALLVCRHTTAARYAEELRARGVPVRISETGWLDSPVITAARAAFAFAANPADTHAGLILRTLGPEPIPLQEGLSLQIAGRLMDDPILARLAELSIEMSDLTVGAALDHVLDITGLRIWADQHPDATQSRADLLRLAAEASEFEVAHRDLKAASGFHGETAKVFLGWLDSRRSERDFDLRPDPAANTAEAVEIVTWHASKGREWPITVVAEFDNGIEERPGSTTTSFDALDRIDDMAMALDSAALIHTPGFAAPESERRFVEDRRSEFEANAKNLLYVALTRARDRLVLEWPSFLKDRPEDEPGANMLFHVLVDECAPQLGDDRLHMAGVDCPATVVRLPELADFTQYSGDPVGIAPRFGVDTPLPMTPLTPWRLQPSQSRGASSSAKSHSIELGKPWPKAINDASRGTALHLALRTCLTRPDLLSALSAATGLEDTTISLVSERAEELKAWLTNEGYTDLRTEVPLLGRSPDGAEIPGIIDLLAVGTEGCLVIDHKSGGDGQGFGSHWPQLSSYGALVKNAFPQHPLKGLAVFWLDKGRLELASPNQDPVSDN